MLNRNKFIINEIKMTNLSWSATILIENRYLEEVKNKYNIKLIFDLEPFDDAIKEAELEKLKSEWRLIPLNINYDLEIVKKKESKERAIVDHPDIEFIAKTIEVKYDPKWTKIKFRIWDDTIDKLNDKKWELYKYFIELIEIEPVVDRIDHNNMNLPDKKEPWQKKLKNEQSDTKSDWKKQTMKSQKKLPKTYSLNQNKKK